MTRLLCTLIVLFFVSGLIAQINSEQVEQLDKIVAKNVSGLEPGLAIGIIADGEVIYKRFAGYSNLEHKVEVSDSSVFNIASVSKQFTALCILKLQIEGKLSLEDDIREYMPDMLPDIVEPIRIRHLINHTSGIRDYVELMSIQQDAWWRRVGLDNEDVIGLLKQQKELNFKPGSEYLYSNSNYTLLTEIIEVVSGTDFHSFSESLFNELGMNDTRFHKNYMGVIPNKARPYTDWGDGIWKEYPMLTNLYGDGFLYTTLEDQLQFEIAIQNATDQKNTLLIQSQVPIPQSEIDSYGFGLELEDRLNYKAVHHSGSTGSYHAQTVRFPEEKLSIVVMSNHGNIWSGYVADAVARVFLEERSGEIGSFELPDNAKTTAIDDQAIVGWYQNPDGSIRRIYEDEQHFYWKAGNNNPRKLNKVEGAVYQIEESQLSRLVFQKENEKISGFALHYRDGDQRSYDRLPDFDPTSFDAEDFTGDYYSEELNTAFNISIDDSGLPMLAMENDSDTSELDIIYHDYLLLSNYKIQAERDLFGRVGDLLISINRVNNVRFKKKHIGNFDTEVQLDVGSAQVTNIGSQNGSTSSILLTRNDPKGNEVWSRRYGGKSYDKASNLIRTSDGGFLITGATSSYGKGNYDFYLIKTDAEGETEWEQTFGEFFNDYGLISKEIEGGYLVKGTQQYCNSNTDINRACNDQAWILHIDHRGKLIKEAIQELPEGTNP
ncbi:MAG: beta-lactamase family protein [Bacteroidia bacterium]|nr:beta-lactamase family protein [Bacteroidia bacterium]